MPKTIAILAPSAVPYEVGGAEKFWWGLRQALTDYTGAFVELIKLPCREKSFTEILDSYEMFSKLDLRHFDMLVSTKYPAWIAPHPNHICYMQHTLRGLYDTYASTGMPETLAHIPPQIKNLIALARKPQPDREDFAALLELCRHAMQSRSLPSELFAFPGPLIREIVHFFDRVALAPGQIKAWLAISRNVASRKDYLPEGVTAKILPHPSDLRGLHGGRGQYFFTASRLHSNKRIRLIADAMRHIPENIPLKIAGTGPELEYLRERFATDPRIEFLGYVPDAEIVSLYAGAICVPYAPIDEDYGLITIEAMQSGKPVITAPDSGGVCEFVKDGETGFIVNPYPPDFARAMRALATDPQLAARMGEKARQSVEHIDWQHTAAEFMKHAEDTRSRPTALVCAPFAADENGAGGPRRLHYFCMELANSFNVRLVCYGSQSAADVKHRDINANFHETALPWPKEVLDLAAAIASETSQSSDDIALMRLCAEDRRLGEALGMEGKGADCVIASHPWLYPAIRATLPLLPMLYDAHNVEADMKTAVFGAGSIASESRRLEESLCQAAKAVFACTDADATRLGDLYELDRAAIALLPNGCAAADPKDRKALRERLGFPETPVAIFIGSDHRPNVEAALRIFELAKELPEIQFLLVGSVCFPPVVARIERPQNLHLLGLQPEKVKNVLLDAATFGLNPVASGSGSNLKILEYLAHGLACVSTPIGSRGLPEQLEPAVHLCEPDQFAAKLRQLLDNPPDTAQVASVGRQIAAKFSWKSTLANLCDRVSAICRPERSSAPAH